MGSRRISPLLHVSFILLMGILLIAAAGCASKDRNAGTPGGESSTSLQKELKDADNEVDKEIDDGSAAEAKKWLSSELNGFWNESSISIKEIVQKYYDAGAPRVYVTGIEEFQGKRISASIAVELPSDKAGREKVFKADESLATELGDDEPIKDIGQKYIHRSFD